MGRDSRERGGRDFGFLPLRTISHFTYEMVDNRRETAREGSFRKQRHGCPSICRIMHCYINDSSLLYVYGGLQMSEDSMLKSFSMSEIVTEDDNWTKYSALHDSFLEELSYSKRKCHKTDIWLLDDM